MQESVPERGGKIKREKAHKEQEAAGGDARGTLGGESCPRDVSPTSSRPLRLHSLSTFHKQQE